MNFITRLSLFFACASFLFLSCKKDSNYAVTSKNPVQFLKLESIHDTNVIHRIDSLLPHVDNNGDSVPLYFSIDLTGLRKWHHNVKIWLRDANGTSMLENGKRTKDMDFIKKSIRVRNAGAELEFVTFYADRTHNNKGVAFDYSSWNIEIEASGQKITKTINLETCEDQVRNRTEVKIDCGGDCTPCYNLLTYNTDDAIGYDADYVDGKIEFRIKKSDFQYCDIHFEMNTTDLSTELDMNTKITEVNTYVLDTSYSNNYIDISSFDRENGSISGTYNIRGTYTIQNGTEQTKTVSGQFANLRVFGL